MTMPPSSEGSMPGDDEGFDAGRESDAGEHMPPVVQAATGPVGGFEERSMPPGGSSSPLLTGDARTATSIALEDSELLCLDRDTFGVLLQENPPIAQTMSEILASRSQATQKRLTQERETMVRNNSGEESGSKKILEKIWTIFRSRK